MTKIHILKTQEKTLNKIACPFFYVISSVCSKINKGPCDHKLHKAEGTR